MAKRWGRKDPDNPLNTEHNPKTYKQTKKWCRGKINVPHVTHLVIDKSGWRQNCCGWIRWNSSEPEKFWRCCHIEQCINCGKILKHFIVSKECPDYPDVADSKSS